MIGFKYIDYVIFPLNKYAYICAVVIVIVYKIVIYRRLRKNTYNDSPCTSV